MKDMVKVVTAFDAYTRTMGRDDKVWALAYNTRYDTLFVLGFEGEPVLLDNEKCIAVYHQFPEVMAMYYDLLTWKSISKL